MLSKFSVKKPYTVIVAVILVIVLGVISFANMTTDLLPNMDLPYVAVYTTYIGATPEQVESDVTRPMEASFATLPGIDSINSTSSENLSLVVMEFESGVDMNSVMIELSSQLDMLRGSWDDAVGAPVVMQIDPNMLPVSIASVSLEGADVHELTDFVEGEILPRLEGIDGVASVSVSGAVEETVAVTIDEERIELLNSLILREVDDELAEVEAQLSSAQSQISEGKRLLAREKSNALAQIDSAQNMLSDDSLEAAIAGAREQRDGLQAQLEQTEAAIAALESLTSLTPEQQAQLDAFNARLAALRAEREAKQARLEALQNAVSDPAAQAQYDEAVAQREELLARREGLEAYIEEQKLRDPEALRGEIGALEGQIGADRNTLAALDGEIATMEGQAETLRARIEELEAQIGEAEATPVPSPSAPPTSAPSGVPTDAPTGEPTDGPTDAPTDEPTDAPTGEPTDAPTDEPTDAPTGEPTDAPTGEPTDAPTGEPTDEPADTPTGEPTDAPNGSESALSALFAGNVAAAEGTPVDALKQQLAEAQAALGALETQLDERAKRREALNQSIEDDEARLAGYRETLAALEASGEGEDTTQRVEEAQRQIDEIDAQVKELDATIAALEAGRLPDAEREAQIQALTEEIAVLDGSISAIEDSEAYKLLMLASDKDAYDQQYAALSAAKAQLTAAIAQLDGMLAKLEAGTIPGGLFEGVDEDTSVADARAALSSARTQALSAFADAESQLSEADSQLAQARSEFYEQRDAALEDAGLDGVITMEMVSALIGAQNFSMPAGYAGQGEDSYMVRVGDEFSSLNELKNMRLFSLGMESVDVVSLSDVATVEIVDNADEVFTKVNGEDGMLLSFQKQSNQSTADVAGRITEELNALSGEYEGLTFVELMNQGDYIDIVIDSVLSNLLSGAALAILVLLLFLLDFRPTLIIALSIPISVVIAFVAMYFTGITLNVLSLSGLALGIGMLVDNSIVSIENIYRLHNEEGVPVLRACVEGVKQISGALIASTLTTVCVFLPVVFVQGITRDLFSDIGLTITYSLLASLLVAMTVVPTMSAAVLKRSKPHKERFEAVRRGYAKLLRGALKAKVLVLLLAVALLGYSVWETMQMSMSFMPEVSSPQMNATLVFNEGMSESEKESAAMELMDGMLNVPSVEAVGMTSGSMMGIGGGEEGLGESLTYYIIVDEAMERSNQEIGADISALGAQAGLDVTVQTSSMDISMLSGEGISINIEGDDLTALRQAATEVAELARGVEGTGEVSDGLEDSTPELTVVVNKDAANEEGLTVAQVYQFVATKLAGAQEITQVTLDGKDYPLTVADGRDLALEAADIENLEIEVTQQDGVKMVRVGDIASIDETMSLSSIARRDQQRSVTVTLNAAEGHALSKVSDALEEALSTYTPPAGCTVGLSGENETVRSIMDDMLLVIGVALVFIFLIMVAQFQSFKSPIIVMFTIPLAFTGGLLALLITGLDLSVVAMVGFLLLAGVVVNNGIVFVDCVNQLRIGGMSKKEALVETGRMRLRPILMTALTTILGMSTMALGTGMGAEMMQPMAIVSIGGLTYATLMTLFVVPVLYDIVNGEKMKAREIEMIRESAGLRDDAELLGDGQSAPQGEAKAAAEAEKPSASTAVKAGSETPQGNHETPQGEEDDAPTYLVFADDDDDGD